LSEPNPNYWRVKAAELEFQMSRQTLHGQLQQKMQEEFNKRFEVELKPLLARRAVVVEDAGLDPLKNYRLDDATQTIIEIP
jgi:hypothetical protein